VFQRIGKVASGEEKQTLVTVAYRLVTPPGLEGSFKAVPDPGISPPFLVGDERRVNMLR
jgi:hypothetical protein